MPETAPSVEIGYHGTSQNAWESIKRTNFNHCKKRAYLGFGAYFFTEGISDPVEDATLWAIWQGKLNVPRWRTYVVIKAEISTEYMLDLTDPEQLASFNKIRRVVYKKFSGVTATKVSPAYEEDANNDIIRDIEILDAAREAATIHVVKCQLYFKLSYGKGIGSRIPNVTVLCVYDCKTAIQTNKLRAPHWGNIS